MGLIQGVPCIVSMNMADIMGCPGECRGHYKRHMAVTCYRVKINCWPSVLYQNRRNTNTTVQAMYV